MEDLKEEISGANTLNEIWTVLNKHYDLDKPLGYITGKVVKNLLLKNFEKLVAGAGIKKRDYAETEQNNTTN